VWDYWSHERESVASSDECTAQRPPPYFLLGSSLCMGVCVWLQYKTTAAAPPGHDVVEMVVNFPDATDVSARRPVSIEHILQLSTMRSSFPQDHVHLVSTSIPCQHLYPCHQCSQTATQATHPVERRPRSIVAHLYVCIVAVLVVFTLPDCTIVQADVIAVVDVSGSMQLPGQ
jgi:hypothetical protein